MGGTSRRLSCVAAELASGSELGMHHGALVMRGRRVIGCGVNRYGARTLGSDSVHAEVSALRGCGRECLQGVTVMVVRVGADGGLRESKPCEACQRFMRRMGVRKCMYSDFSSSIRSIQIAKH